MLRVANLSDIDVLKRAIANDIENSNWSNDIDFLAAHQYLYVWGEKPIGFILSQQIDIEAEIIMVWLDNAERGQGVGKQMIKALMPKLKTKGVQKVFLEVAIDNIAAIKSYENAGFNRLGIRKNYYKRANNTYMDAINMGATI